MSRKPLLRVAERQSHPHPDMLLTFMVVLTRRTFTWTVRRKHFFWTAGIAMGIWAVAVIGSGYGLWATKKMMNFSHLQQETMQQQEQLRESLEQADTLQRELSSLQGLVEELMKQIDPRALSLEEAEREIKGSASSESSQKVTALKNELDQADDRLKKLQAKMAPVLDRWSHTPSVMPTTGFITSGFGMRIHPFFRSGGGEEDGLASFHSGIDIANEIGTPIQATANGTVIFAEPFSNYGLTVIIRHSSELETLYGHLYRTNVRVGQEVMRGDIIGAMGRTGRATGVHLHYEVRKHGQPINPRPYLRLQSQWLSGLK
ncbi:MAG: peptidoglycan DD-metalloendopeptidase family protein [Holophagales bacterium]|nr:peptidoglycan DD-metalloendopeptidase family protein [Holophagales bacterium]